MRGSFTNKTGLPDFVVCALTKDDYSRGESNRSWTQLINAPRQNILRQEHQDEIERDVADLVWIALGNSVHKLLEDAINADPESDWTSEQLFFLDVNGWTISGQVDALEKLSDLPLVNLLDHKVTSVWTYIYSKDSWEKQLNGYAYLVYMNGMEVSDLYVLALFRDWKQRDADNNADYPQAPIMLVEIPRWSTAKQREYVEERVRVHQEAEFERLTGADLPHCTPEERWMREGKFAVMKNANKRAIKLFDTMKDALDHVAILEEKDKNPKNKYWVEERSGVPVRCENEKLCPVNRWCDQWQKEVSNVG